jgi:hypothetical protein
LSGARLLVECPIQFTPALGFSLRGRRFGRQLDFRKWLSGHSGQPIRSSVERGRFCFRWLRLRFGLRLRDTGRRLGHAHIDVESALLRQLFEPLQAFFGLFGNIARLQNGRSRPDLRGALGDRRVALPGSQAFQPTEYGVVIFGRLGFGGSFYPRSLWGGRHKIRPRLGWRSRLFVETFQPIGHTGRWCNRLGLLREPLEPIGG